MKKRIVFAVIIVLVLVGTLLVFTSKGEQMKYDKIPPKTLADLSAEDLKKLSGMRIYFGHQSVGGGIIRGLEALNEKVGALNLDIRETENLLEHEGPVFAHSRVGENTKPKSKVDHFVKIMENGLQDKVDVAMFKFCYADINTNTDIKDEFEYYKKAMERLQKKYPNVIFVHSTVPYYRKSGGLKGIVKRVLDRDYNLPRDHFNRFMRDHYEPGQLFDLGVIEATYPDGRREQGDKSAYALAPIYTHDGGHFNDKGKEMVAIQFLHFLASLK